MNRADRKRQLREDEARLKRGLVEFSEDEVVSLMRLLDDRIRVTIRDKSINPLMEYFYNHLAVTIRGLRDIPIECKKGCSFCCNIWVAACPPEIFYVAKRFKGRELAEAKATVSAAYSSTKDQSFDERGDLVTPCPLLKSDICSVYEHRPLVCRTAASPDAALCKRSYLELSGEDIKIPYPYMSARSIYGVALVGALKRHGLTYSSYEFNDALNFALDSPNAERAWLAGDDVFANVRAEVGDAFAAPHIQRVYHQAFAD